MTLTKYFIIISLLAVSVPTCTLAKRKSGCSTATITTEYDEEKKENVTTWTCNGYDDNERSDCFLGSTVIYDKDGYKLSLDEAKTGDIILDGEGKPTKIVGWLHKSSRDESMIVRIEDYNGGVIEVTHRHLLFDKDGVARFAETFGAGERLSIGNNDYITVMDIRTYTAPANWLAPITESGTIRIGLSKVKASCYAEVEHHTLAHYYVKAKHFLSGYDGSRPHFDHKVLGALKWIGLV